MTADIEKVVVIGAGTMGAGIAAVCAKAGCTVGLTDLDPASLEAGMARVDRSLARAVDKSKLSAADAEAVRDRIRTSTNPHDATAEADLVVEAVFESMSLKKDLLAQAGQTNGRALLASNTSSLSVTEIAAACPHPSRVIGLHFFNPPPVMPLLEVVCAEQTDPEVVVRACGFAERLGKTPIVVRDFPGFATSRLGIALGLEAIRMLEQGVASVEDIDRAMELGYRHPMGPLKLTDLIGLDVRLAIADHLSHELGPRFAPPPLLRQLVRAGKLGQKAGEGFYRWNDGKAEPS